MKYADHHNQQEQDFHVGSGQGLVNNGKVNKTVVRCAVGMP